MAAATSTYVLQISEEELSSLFATMAQQGVRNPTYAVQTAQIVILPDGLEIFMQMTWHGFVHIDLLTRMTPVLQSDGGLRFDVTETTLGDVSLRSEWVRPLIAYLFDRDLGIWYVKMGEDIDIQAVTLFDRSLQLLLGITQRSAPQTQSTP